LGEGDVPPLLKEKKKGGGEDNDFHPRRSTAQGREVNAPAGSRSPRKSKCTNGVHEAWIKERKREREKKKRKGKVITVACLFFYQPNKKEAFPLSSRREVRGGKKKGKEAQTRLHRHVLRGFGCYGKREPPPPPLPRFVNGEEGGRGRKKGTGTPRRLTIIRVEAEHHSDNSQIYGGKEETRREKSSAEEIF